MRSADKNDPIYKGGFVISSHSVRPQKMEDPRVSKGDANKEKPKKQD
jgi:hypothetical protein